MELRHIHTFLILAEELHFGRAAARLHVVQSAVTKRLQELEADVGTPLIARTRRHVELTVAGVQFLEHARRSIRTLEHATSAARSAANGSSGHVRLRFTLLTGLSPVPAAIAHFRRTHPGVELTIDHGTSADNLNAVAVDRCDLAFTTLRNEVVRPLSCEHVTKEPLVALIPEGHRLARRRTVSFRALEGEPRVVLSRRAEPELHAAHYAPPVRIALEVDQIDTMLAFVAEGFGIACAPRSVTRLQMEGVSWVPISPREIAGLSVVWNPTSLAPAAGVFLEVLRKVRAGGGTSP